MKYKNTSISESFKHAVDGLKAAFDSERNIKVQLTVMTLIIIISLFLKLTPIEWSVVIIVMILVLSAELLNTSIEVTIDMFCKEEYNELAKKAKDVGAGAALLATIGAAIVGVIILLPKIINLIYNI